MTNPERKLEIIETMIDMVQNYNDYIEPINEFIDSIDKEFDTQTDDNEDLGIINCILETNNMLLSDIDLIHSRLQYVYSWILDKTYKQDNNG